MSIDRCTCGNLVDTDYDDQAYGETGESPCTCAHCRDVKQAEALAAETPDA